MCDVVCDVCDDVCDVVSHVVGDDVCDVVCYGMYGGEGFGNVEWLILCCFGVLIYDEQTNGRTDISSRVAFATEN